MNEFMKISEEVRDAEQTEVKKRAFTIDGDLYDRYIALAKQQEQGDFCEGMCISMQNLGFAQMLMDNKDDWQECEVKIGRRGTVK